MTKQQVAKLVKIWTRLQEVHEGSQSELVIETISEYLKPHHKLLTAVNDALPLLKHYENKLAGSLSCDSRSHDDDREPRRQLNAILKAVKTLE